MAKIFTLKIGYVALLLFVACRPSDTSQIFGDGESVSLVTGVDGAEHAIWVQKGENNIIPFMIHAARFQVGAENALQIADVVYSYVDRNEIHTCGHKLVSLNLKVPVVPADNCYTNDKGKDDNAAVAFVSTDYVGKFAQLCAATEGYGLEVTLVDGNEDDFVCHKGDTRIAAECFIEKHYEDEKCKDALSDNESPFKLLYGKAVEHYTPPSAQESGATTLTEGAMPAETLLSDIVVNYEYENVVDNAEPLIGIPYKKKGGVNCSLKRHNDEDPVLADCVDGQNLLELYKKKYPNTEDAQTLGGSGNLDFYFSVRVVASGVFCGNLGNNSAYCSAAFNIWTADGAVALSEADVLCLGVVNGKGKDIKKGNFQGSGSCLEKFNMQEAYKVTFSLKSQE